jgi:hypothetical protein
VRRGRVVIVDFEMDSDEPYRRLQMLGAGEEIMLTSFPPYNPNDASFWRELEKLKANLVILNSLAAGSCADFGELDSRFAEPLRHAAHFVAEQATRIPPRPCSFIVLHHSLKGASLRDAESLFRGTGAIRGGVDTAYYFERVNAEAGAPTARLTSVKSRKGMPAASFSIRLTDARGLELVDDRKPKGQPRRRAADLRRAPALVRDEAPWHEHLGGCGCAAHAQRALHWPLGRSSARGFTSTARVRLAGTIEEQDAASNSVANDRR